MATNTKFPKGPRSRSSLRLREIKTAVFAVERNREVVPRKLHECTRLAPGDQVEIAVAVGGG